MKRLNRPESAAVPEAVSQNVGIQKVVLPCQALESITVSSDAHHCKRAPHEDEEA